jgi:flagellar hook-associated protein 2
MPNSIGGLASGLDTSAIITSLMANERAGRSRLEVRESTLTKQLGVWQNLKSQLGSLQAATDAFRSVGQAAATKVTSSNADAVGVTSAPGTAPGTYTIRVKQLATAHQLRATGFSGTGDLVGAGKGVVASSLASVGIAGVTAIGGSDGGRYDIEVRSVDATNAVVSFGGREQTVARSGPVTLDDGKGNTMSFDATDLKVGKARVGVVETDAATTVAGLAGKVNALGVGVSALAVDLNDGSGQPVNFILSAAAAGTANGVTVDFGGLTGFTGAFTDLRAAGDAKILLADGTTEVTRSSNQVTDLVPGLTLDLRAADAGKDVTVTVAQDNTQVVQATKTLVDSLNAVLSNLKRSSAYDPTTRTAAALTGDSRARRVQDSLREAMQYRDDDQDLNVLAELGITIGRDGLYSVNEAKLSKALTDDYSGTLRLLAGDGADRRGAFGAVREATTRLQASRGLVDGAVTSAQSAISGLHDDMARFDARLSMVEDRIRRKYTQLESTLAQLSSQSTGLARSLG